MTGMAKKKPKPPQPAAGGEESSDAKARNAIFITLDDAAEAKLQRFLGRQRVRPTRAAIALAALLEFLDREESARS